MLLISFFIEHSKHHTKIIHQTVLEILKCILHN